MQSSESLCPNFSSQRTPTLAHTLSRAHENLRKRSTEVTQTCIHCSRITQMLYVHIQSWERDLSRVAYVWKGSVCDQSHPYLLHVAALPLVQNTISARYGRVRWGRTRALTHQTQHVDNKVISWPSCPCAVCCWKPALYFRPIGPSRAG